MYTTIKTVLDIVSDLYLTTVLGRRMVNPFIKHKAKRQGSYERHHSPDRIPVAVVPVRDDGITTANSAKPISVNKRQTRQSTAAAREAAAREAAQREAVERELNCKLLKAELEAERKAVSAERETVSAERETVSAERETVSAEREAVSTVRRSSALIKVPTDQITDIDTANSELPADAIQISVTECNNFQSIAAASIDSDAREVAAASIYSDAREVAALVSKKFVALIRFPTDQITDIDTANSELPADAKQISLTESKTSQNTAAAGEVATQVSNSSVSLSVEKAIGTANSELPHPLEEIPLAECKTSLCTATTAMAAAAGEVATQVSNSSASLSVEKAIGTANSELHLQKIPVAECKTSLSAATAGEVATLVPNKLAKPISVAAGKTSQTSANTSTAANRNNSRLTTRVKLRSTRPKIRRMHSSAAHWNSSEDRDMHYPTHRAGAHDYDHEYDQGNYDSYGVDNGVNLPQQYYSPNYGAQGPKTDDCEIVSLMNTPVHQPNQFAAGQHSYSDTNYAEDPYAPWIFAAPRSHLPVHQRSYIQGQSVTDRFGQPFYQPRSRQPLPQNRHINAPPQFPDQMHVHDPPQFSGQMQVNAPNQFPGQMQVNAPNQFPARMQVPGQNQFVPQRRHINQPRSRFTSSAGEPMTWLPFSSRKRNHD